MEERSSRPRFYNPYHRGNASANKAVLKGLFRAVTFHRHRPWEIRGLLKLVGRHPVLFGLPAQSTCVVCPLSFIPSIRSRAAGVAVYGAQRGCRSLIIPGSANKMGLDNVDAKLIEPLLRINPSVDYVYLSRECQSVATELAPLLKHCKVKTLTLCDWTDTRAIREVALSCRQLDTLDGFSVHHSSRDWRTENDVQELCTLIEMHPKLKTVTGTREFLNQWFEATRLSRCKHNIALVPAGCPYVLVWVTMWVALVVVVYGLGLHAVLDIVLPFIGTPEGYAASTVIPVAIVCGRIGYEYANSAHLGLTWSRWLVRAVAGSAALVK